MSSHRSRPRPVSPSGPVSASSTERPDAQRMIERVAEALQSLRHGRVEILVQDGRIVLVEKHERARIYRDSV